MLTTAQHPFCFCPEHRYLVKTVTPNDSGAGTDADVYVMLVGSLGDSGIRELKQNLEERSKFQPGSVSVLMPVVVVVVAGLDPVLHYIESVLPFLFCSFTATSYFCGARKL